MTKVLVVLKDENGKLAETTFAKRSKAIAFVDYLVKAFLYIDRDAEIITVDNRASGRMYVFQL